MINYLVAVSIILLVLLGWVTVQHWARKFAQRYPELGPAREEGGGCGSSCLCGNNSPCQRAPSSLSDLDDSSTPSA